jgi:hypothetical protein
MFNLDLSQWVNKPDHSATISVSMDFTTTPGAVDAGQVHWDGMLKFTSRTVAKSGSSTGSLRTGDRASP